MGTSCTVPAHGVSDSVTATVHDVINMVVVFQLSETSGVEKLSSQQRQAVARRRLRQMVTSKAQELQHLSCILLHAFLSVWGEGGGGLLFLFFMFGVLVLFLVVVSVAVCLHLENQKSWTWRRKFLSLEFWNLDIVMEPRPYLNF